MARKKIQNRKRINLTVEMENYRVLEILAAKNNVSVPEIIRQFINDGLSNNAENTENIDIVIDIIRKQLKLIIDPAVDRLAALSSKACIQSATAAYLTAETINKFVPDEYQEDYYEAYEAARKKAIEYIKTKKTE